MENISRVMTRIEGLRSQLGVPARSADFSAMLDNRVASADPLSDRGSNIPTTGVTTVPTTLGGLPLGGPLPGTASPWAGGTPTVAAVDAYVREHSIDSRNGRLDASELHSISGGWDGREFSLIEPAAESFEKMRAAAAADGIDLRVIDAYRSWEVQARAYEDYLAGRKKAHVLPPGTSEHGKGMAIDVTNGAILDKGDPEWSWLQENAQQFGWHPISNEAWHWEFRGV
jgi:hypothetical protein